MRNTIFVLVIWICLAQIVNLALAADIALIIDDMGNKTQDAQAFELPSEVTFSILPHKTLSQPYSLRAEQQQREVMLHIPMESLGGKRLGPGGITSDMGPSLITQLLSQALLTVPNAVGVNNHMGSKLTQLTLPMSVTMEFLHKRGLYFVDSRTTRYSKAENIAKQKGVLSTKRNVFLDHVADYEHIDAQFKRLIYLAKKYGQAVGIGHPYPQSMQYLKAHLPTLAAQGIRLVPLSDLLHEQQRLAKLSSHSVVITDVESILPKNTGVQIKYTEINSAQHVAPD
ncbi:MAG: polysaccharide deacetylase 2 family uncharacterized protein YibQ [Paraglaciecola sp.]